MTFKPYDPFKPIKPIIPKYEPPKIPDLVRDPFRPNPLGPPIGRQIMDLHNPLAHHPFHKPIK